MVAISLYRGNLHRVPDVPRRWPMPPRTITIGSFRALLERRSRALSGSQPSETVADAPECVEESRPSSGEKEGMGESGCPKPGQALLLSSSAEVAPEIVETKEVGQTAEIGEGGGPGEAGAVKLAASENNAVEEGKAVDVSGSGEVEASGLDGGNEVELRKRDLEKKLDVLNEKKHHLVQMLKQILNAEEEIKKRTSIQPASGLASFLSQADATTAETGSAMKIAAPRMTVEVNFSGDHSGGYSHLMHSPSPSSVSPFNRPGHGFFHNSANTSRGLSASTSHGSMTASPSRFAPLGHPGHAASQPVVSVSGTPFLASSPSPAGSGGASSVFRDSHLTSP